MINASKLGDVTKIFLAKTQEGEEIEVEVPECLVEGRNTLLYNDIIKMVNPKPWFDAAQD